MNEIKAAISELIQKTSGKTRSGLARHLTGSLKHRIKPEIVSQILNEDGRKVPATWIKPTAEYLGVTSDFLLSYRGTK